ncbi:expressed unknown protein [Seminavis robusta]|uniref:Uncharacterized protein n=1 Tax=Seminavis robusta TaxID=568900 RepID=A0A9N8DZ51_9STRA|nr:expressed unknown protein [Seminavis robusta]|eukprot:Sro383_g131240.1 n/a (104) ;mRNA; f:15717-16203
MCNDVGSTSRCCAFYSAVGVIFTLWVGVMITTQPFFIGGLEDPDEAKSSAFGAMGAFIFTFVVSLLGMWYDTNHKIDDTASVDGPEAEYHLATGDVPTYGTSS